MAGFREAGAVSPQTMRRILTVVQAFERMHLDAKASLQAMPSTPVYFKNVSGEKIPPYGCVQPVGAVEFGGQNYIEVTKPVDLTSALQGPFLFNRHFDVENNEFGTAQPGPVFRVALDGGTYSVNERLGPVDTSFTIGSGCLYSYLGPDDIAANVGRVVFNNSAISVTVGSGGIAAGSSGPITYRIPASSTTGWMDTAIEYTGWNDSASALNEGDRGIAFPVDARWVVVGVC